MAPYDHSATPKPRLRSRTSTLSRTPREGSPGLPAPPGAPDAEPAPGLDSASAPSSAVASSASTSPATLGASTAHVPAGVPALALPRAGRRASKSVSLAAHGRPQPQQRGMSYHSSLAADAIPESSSAGQAAAAAAAGPGAPLLVMPAEQRRAGGLKRRISTPDLANQRLLSPEPDEAPLPEEPTDASGLDNAAASSSSTAAKKTESRARSTSTSVVVPAGREPFQPTISIAPPLSTVSDHGTAVPSPDPPARASLPTDDPFGTDDHAGRAAPSLTAAVHSAIVRVVDWATSAPHHHRRDSSSDSEKGLDGSEDEPESGSSRDGPGGLRRGGRYWGIFASEDAPDAAGEGGYFSLPPSPALDEKDDSMGRAFGLGVGGHASLPTPALSRSLRAAPRRRGSERDGWWIKVYRKVAGGKGDGRTAEVLRELGWTVAALGAVFVVSLLIVVGLIQGMPITQLKHLPKSTTDLQLLSAEIRAYMASGTSSWWHTVGVLTFVGCWKHAWSVPGAVVLNILVGSLLEPVPALGLLTIITACGSLFAYLLSRPLAPLIAVLFPKPLALVRAALAPDSDPSPSATHHDTVTPLQLSADPTARPVGGEAERANVWRRLLVMRAMGFVPWSGMNVACGVVGVDWKTFWLTTAAGSASWSYVTASVGNILARLAVPTTTAALAASAAVDPAAGPGESLTSLLRDPVLIAKLVFLTLLTLIPVLLKRRAPAAASAASTPTLTLSAPSPPLTPPLAGAPHLPPHLRASLAASSAETPMSPLTASLAHFTPTPRAFDLLSFGRTALRTSVSTASGTVRTLTGGARRVAGRVLG